MFMVKCFKIVLICLIVILKVQLAQSEETWLRHVSNVWRDAIHSLSRFKKGFWRRIKVKIQNYEFNYFILYKIQAI